MRQAEQAQSQKESNNIALPSIKPGHGAEVYGRTGRMSRLLRMNHRLRDERRLSAHDWRHEGDAQEEISDQNQSLGDE